MARKIFVFYDGYRRHIGDWYAKNRVFVKEVERSKHLFRVLNAYGVDSSFFNKVLLPKDALIRVHEREEDMVYRAKAEVFKEKGQYFHFKENTKDHYTQIFLPLEFWEKENEADRYHRQRYGIKVT